MTKRTKNIKACIVAYSFYDLDYRVRRYAEALVEKGHEIDVIALRAKGEKARGSLNGVNIYRIQERSYNERGRFDYLFRNLSFLIRGALLLSGKHIISPYDLIHVHNVPDFLIFMGLLPKILHAKLILDIHDILPEFFCQKFGKGMRSKTARFLMAVEKASTRLADHVIVANDLWREKIIARDKLPPETCTTLLNYPNMAFFRNKETRDNREDGLRIIYPGTISHHHGLDILVKALALVKQNIAKVRLDIYARSNNIGYFNELIRLIEELNLQENIFFHDPVPIEQLAQIYETANMGVVPKRGGIFASEAFSTKMFDFMAVGLPIIASRTKIDEYYFDNSMIAFFEPENHSDLAQRIVDVYGNANLRMMMVKKGKAYVAINNWEIKKKGYLDLVDRLVNKKSKTLNPKS